ncbi:MAG: hypothetical protein KJP04_11740, partial [Arenicella sp.]|nr:hypothetical protein [Arenicella sp.]
MKKSVLILLLTIIMVLPACEKPAGPEIAADTTSDLQPVEKSAAEEFNWRPERFADIQIIRYQVPGFDQLSLSQKSLVYYLVQAGMEGRDITWDQNYRHNLAIRRALEAIIEQSNADKNTDDWAELMLYARRVFFANGIHHHYSGDKFKPGFSEEYLSGVLQQVGRSLNDDAMRAIFDAGYDAKKVNQDPEKDLVKDSAVNFYGPDITADEVTAYYAAKTDVDPARPVLH